MTMSIYEMEATWCIVCGVDFAMPARLIKKRREDGLGFHCPNGHSLTFKDNEHDKIRRERDQLKQDNARLVEDAQAARRSVVKAEKETKRLKRRAVGGACPCCNRSFQNMARHMKTKHPDFVSSKVVSLDAAKKAKS